MISISLKKNTGYLAGACGLSRLLTGRAVIFMFHRVVPAEVYEQTRFHRSIMVTEEGFDTFLTWLAAQFEVVPLSSLLDGITSLPTSTRPKAILTFDDGWLDNFLYAYPILQQRALPATIFLSTDFIDSAGGFWWQDLGEILTCQTLPESVRENIILYAGNTFQELTNPGDIFQNPDGFIELLKRRHASRLKEICAVFHGLTGTLPVNRCLSWEQCNIMSAGLIEFGSHGISHPMLSILDDAQMDMELRDSKVILREKDLKYVDAVSYPYGDYDARVVASAAKYYRLGVTTRIGMLSPLSAIGSHSMVLPRINIPEKVTRSRALLQYRLLKAVLNNIGRE